MNERTAVRQRQPQHQAPKYDPVLDEIFKKVPQADLARRLTEDMGRTIPGFKITRMAINQWIRVPDRFVRLVAGYTGLPLKKIRRDLYDPRYGMPAVG